MKRTYWFSDRLGVDYNPQEAEERVMVPTKAEANLISSLCEGQNPADAEALHMPALDIDLPCWLRESETPGHFHLLIDKPMHWFQYERLLDVLEELGIVEPGYRDASVERGQTFLALHPWKEGTHAVERDDAGDAGAG